MCYYFHKGECTGGDRFEDAGSRMTLREEEGVRESGNGRDTRMNNEYSSISIN
jgi:hypothetical protein